MYTQTYTHTGWYTDTHTHRLSTVLLSVLRQIAFLHIKGQNWHSCWKQAVNLATLRLAKGDHPYKTQITYFTINSYLDTLQKQNKTKTSPSWPPGNKKNFSISPFLVYGTCLSYLHQIINSAFILFYLVLLWKDHEQKETKLQLFKHRKQDHFCSIIYESLKGSFSSSSCLRDANNKI